MGTDLMIPTDYFHPKRRKSPLITQSKPLLGNITDSQNLIGLIFLIVDFYTVYPGGYLNDFGRYNFNEFPR